jgi:hypothetical protein
MMDPDEESDEDFHMHFIQICAIARINLLLSARVCIVLYASCFVKVPQHTFILSGQGWINELITGHDGRFYNEMGMHKHVYWNLLSVLRKDASLCITRHVSAKE